MVPTADRVMDTRAMTGPVQPLCGRHAASAAPAPANRFMLLLLQKLTGSVYVETRGSRASWQWFFSG
jgi:hypothetical protein